MPKSYLSTDIKNASKKIGTIQTGIIDFKLLNKQKLVLLNIKEKTTSKKELNALDGVIHLLDSLFDNFLEQEGPEVFLN